MPTKTLIHPGLTGVVVDTGEFGVGKSVMALSADYPENTVLFDFQGKDDILVSQLADAGTPLGVHINMAKLCGKIGQDYSMAEVLSVWRDELDKLPLDQYTVAAIDDAGDIQDALYHDTKQKPGMWGLSSDVVRDNKGGALWGVVNTRMKQLIQDLKGRGFKLIILVCDLKQKEIGGALDKRRIKGVSELRKQSVLTLVLKKNSELGKPPYALVLKEGLARFRFDAATGKYEVSPRIPPRLPVASWAAINDYLARTLTFPLPAEEVPSDEELKPFWDILDADEKKRLEALLQRGVVIGEDD